MCQPYIESATALSDTHECLLVIYASRHFYRILQNFVAMVGLWLSYM